MNCQTDLTFPMQSDALRAQDGSRSGGIVEAAPTRMKCRTDSTFPMQSDALRAQDGSRSGGRRHSRIWVILPVLSRCGWSEDRHSRGPAALSKAPNGRTLTKSARGLLL